MADIQGKFKVEKIVFYNRESKWGVLGTVPLSDIGHYKFALMNAFGSITVSGNFEGVYEDCEIELTGDIKDNPRYGKQIQIVNLKVLQDTKSKEGIINFLARSIIRGISIQNAIKIYNTFKDDAIKVVLNTPEKLIHIKGIGEKTVNKVRDSVAYYKTIEKLVNFGTKLGLPYSLIQRLNDEFGESAVDIIKEDPFKILELSQAITFKQVDDIYLKCNGDPKGKRRLEVAFLYTLKTLAMLEGSTGCLSTKIKKKFYDLLSLSEYDGSYEDTMKDLESEGKIVTDSSGSKDVIYYKEYLDTEASIAEIVKLLNLYGEQKLLIRPEVIKEEISSFPFTLNEQQVKAISTCLSKNVSVLTGAAGCLSGDTVIRYNRARFGGKKTIRDLYNAFHGTEGRRWDKNTKTYVRSFIGAENCVRLNEIEDVVYSGKKPVYLLTLEDGKTIKATSDHKILTKSGFKPLINLTTDDYVMTDNAKKEVAQRKKQARVRDKYVYVGQYHPYKVLAMRKGHTYYRVKRHRAVYDAYKNGMGLNVFLKATKSPNNLVYLDPKVYEIHHKDGDHNNDSPTNLIACSTKEHRVHHGKCDSYKHFASLKATYAKVVSVTCVGEEDTYDICLRENHNFNANGIIVHNSGKSSITKALYKIFTRSGFDVNLLSPTAKACRRLEECTGGKAMTIHKFLGMNVKGEVNESNLPDNTVLIIDEASMMDIILFNHLLNKTNVTSRILLVGDNNQLPSVMAGNVLGDLVSANVIPVAVLTDVMRQKEDSTIINFCNMINKGEVFEPCEKPDFHYEEFGDGEELKDVLIDKYLDEVDKYGLSEVQVITPYKKGELGMDNLNKILQDAYNKNGLPLLDPYRMGDRVRHTQNNYKKDVFNGETGVIVASEDEEITVDYGTKRIVYDNVDIDELTLAYCSTVHASQGSEYKVCFVILDDTAVNDFLFIRRLLYTAVSRGKEKVYILTKPYLVDKCIDNDSYRPRITKLKEFLQKASPLD